MELMNIIKIVSYKYFKMYENIKVIKIVYVKLYVCILNILFKQEL